METNLIQEEINLVTINNGVPMTTSQIIADVFEKDHARVMRDIREKLNNKIGDGEIALTSYTDVQGKNRPMYLLNRDCTTFLIMGFTGRKADAWKWKYIQAFNEMEKRLQNPQPTDDKRLEIARLISRASRYGIKAIEELYPEYFTHKEKKCMLEAVNDLNTSYQKWIDDNYITKEELLNFTTIDIYNNYKSYCIERDQTPTGKKSFYETLEKSFGLVKKQKADGKRYFVTI